jgi:hypothetical protein
MIISLVKYDHGKIISRLNDHWMVSHVLTTICEWYYDCYTKQSFKGCQAKWAYLRDRNEIFQMFLPSNSCSSKVFGGLLLIPMFACARSVSQLALHWFLCGERCKNRASLRLDRAIKVFRNAWWYDLVPFFCAKGVQGGPGDQHMETSKPAGREWGPPSPEETPKKKNISFDTQNRS